MASSRSGRMRVVIVDPSYASGVGHHHDLNTALGSALTAAGHTVEVWADAALPGSAVVRQVSSGCGYVDQRHWADLAGSLYLAARLRRQLEAAVAADSAAGSPPVHAWLAHSLLPFQLIALAQLLQHQPPARVVLSLMFAPAETLGGSRALEPSQLQQQASLNTRTALQALAQACRLGGHQLVMGSGSAQTLALHAPLLEAAGLPQGCLHPAVVGAGLAIDPRIAGRGEGADPCVLLHWGDLKPDKGRSEALGVVEALVQASAAQRPACRWLFHAHSQSTLAPIEQALLEEAQRQLGDRFLWLHEQHVPGDQMQQWLANCDLALLAYSPHTYAERSSGVLWCYAAARYTSARPATAVGYGGHWLAHEAQTFGMSWITAPAGLGSSDGAGWLEILRQSLPQAQATPAQWTAAARQVLGQSFAHWVVQQLSASKG
jgi:hypothetical protein